MNGYGHHRCVTAVPVEREAVCSGSVKPLYCHLDGHRQTCAYTRTRRLIALGPAVHTADLAV